MAARISFVFPRDFLPANERVRALVSACAHYGRFDRPLFVAAYNELGRVDLNGGRILEVCCGVGELALGVARMFPRAEVIGLDRYPDGGRALREAAQSGQAPNARYLTGDAFRLTDFPDGSLDLVFGQATLHHLAHETEAVGREFARVLKPGGRLVFIYEPFGHNPYWAMIRAYRTAKLDMPDESNVIMSQLQEVGRFFGKGEIQPFNFLGYPFKGLGRLLGEGGTRCLHRLDQRVMASSDRWARQAANFNVFYTKA
jgi:SAM-dependent methyltransferase